MSGTDRTIGSLETSIHADVYSVSTLARTTSLNEASGKAVMLASWLTGAPISPGFSTLVSLRRVASMITEREAVGDRLDAGLETRLLLGGRFGGGLGFGGGFRLGRGLGVGFGLGLLGRGGIDFLSAGGHGQADCDDERETRELRGHL